MLNIILFMFDDGRSVFLFRISEESKLKDLLKRFVKPGALESEFNSTQECNVLFRDHSTNLVSISVDSSNHSIIVKYHLMSQQESRWFLLDHEVKIVENLRHKTVIEVSSYLPADDLMTRVNIHDIMSCSSHLDCY